MNRKQRRLQEKKKSMPALPATGVAGMIMGASSSPSPSTGGGAFDPEVMRQAAALFRDGRVQDAEKICWRALREVTGERRPKPDRAARAEINRLIAAALLGSGDPWSAAEAAGRAAAVDARSPIIQAVRAAALRRINKVAEAETVMRKYLRELGYE